MTILLVDDHALFRSSLVVGLKSQGFNEDVFLEAPTGKEALTTFKKQWIDLVLMDVQMPRMNGYETAKAMLEERQNAKIIVLSMVDTIEAAKYFFTLGVQGYVTKDSPLPKLCEAIRTVYDGGQFFADEIKEPRSSNKVKNISELRFSPQELKRKSSEVIAEEMGLSRRTVEFYKQRAMEKARVQTSTELITFLYRNGLS
jgi:DNA-binding NarL/FixJ family response regulator